MKKIFIIIFLLLLSINIANADSCLIKKNSSKELNNYLNNYKKILNNIESEAKKLQAQKNNSSTIRDFGWYSLRLFNNVIDFTKVKDEWIFLIFLKKFQEIPKEIDRDYKKLTIEDNYIRELAIFISKYGLQETYSENICNWVKNCNLSSKKLWDALEEIKKNNENIKNIFIAASLWKLKQYMISLEKDNKTGELNNFPILIEPNFLNDLESNYWPEALSTCSEEWGFFERIKEETAKIFSNEMSTREWFRTWKEAIELIWWAKTMEKEKYEAIEKNLLKKELQRQWISWDAQDGMLKNLEKYNQDWFSLNNNFFTNTFVQAAKEIEENLIELKNETISNFLENYTEKSNWRQISPSFLYNVKENSDTAKTIKEKIQTLYINSKSSTAIYETKNENLKNRFINSHIELSNAIKTLNNTCKIAVKICNQQDTWNWNCWDCNW